MKQTLLARLVYFSKEEIRDMIPEDTMNRLRSQDSTAEEGIRVYVAGHEGKAEPEVVGGGKMVFNYLKDAVIKLGNKIKHGISVFIGHEGSRQPIGEVIGRGFKEINNRLSALTAIYIKPEYRDRKLDAASIESDIEYSLDSSGIAQVEKFLGITGIALGDANQDKPAFPGATLLASLQNFQKAQGKFTHKGGKMTLEELKQAIQESNFSPSSLFSEEDLANDKAIKAIIKKEKQTEYEHAKRVEKKLAEEREEKMKLEKELNEKVSELNNKLITGEAEGAIKSVMDERKLSEKQVAFIAKNSSGFKSEAKDEEGLKVDVNKFIDKQLQEFNETAKLFGIEEEGKEKKGKEGLPTEDEKTEEEKEEAEDPEKNPLIPKTE